MSYSTVAIQFGTERRYLPELSKNCSLCSVRQQLLTARRNSTSTDEDEVRGYLRGLTGPRPIDGKVDIS